MKRIISLNALYIGSVMTAFFVITDQLHLSEQIGYRFVNVLILAFGMWLTLYRKSKRGKYFGVKYMNGFKQSMRLTAGSVFIFALMFFIYTSTIATDFVPSLIHEGKLPGFFNEFLLSVVVLFEGAATGLVLGLIMMQYFRYSWKIKGKELNYREF